MRRYIPEVRALYERVRRPAITTLVGMGLMAPLGASFLRPATPESANLAATAPGAPNGSKEIPVTDESVSAEPAKTESAKAESAKAESAKTKSGDEAEGASAPKAAEAAPARATKSSGSAQAARFAKQFKIPVTLAHQIHSAAVAEGIDPKVAFGLVQTESSFRRTAISSVGAVGYTQLLPSTANWIAPGTTRSQLFNPQTNLRVGFKYLNYLKDKYNGNMRLALTAYNRGPGTVDRLLKQGRNPENGYATKVLSGRG